MQQPQKSNKSWQKKPPTTPVFNIYGKVPPQANELEEAVLGAILLEKDRLEEVLEIIPKSECFYVSAHQKIFEAIRNLFFKTMPVDLLTVTEELRKTNDLEIVGGAYFLTKLTMNVVSSAHVEAHARIIIEKYIDRELIRIGGEMMEKSYAGTEDTFEMMDDAQEELYELSNRSVKKDFVHVARAIAAAMTKIQDGMGERKAYTGVPTPFNDLNEVTGGWQKSTMIVPAARPSVGKTAFAICCALVAAMAGCPAAIFNLEMPIDEVVNRMLSNISEVPLEKIKKPWMLSPDEVKRLSDASVTFARLPIYIDDTAKLGILEFRTKARRLKLKHGIQLIILDYLQLMSGDSSNKGYGNREQEISKISRDIKITAKELEIPIIALSQLNRAADTRANNEPVLSDLRESGSIEQDADIVMLLYTPSKKTLESKPNLEGMVMLDLAKHRNGAKKDFVYRSNNHIQKWTELDDGIGNFRPMTPQEKSGTSFNSSSNNNNNKAADDLPF